MTNRNFAPFIAQDGATLVLEIHNKKPIDLLDFTAALRGLAREHEAEIKKSRPSLALEESRLFVVDVRKGSIVMELVAALAPLVGPAELVNTSVDFVRNFSSAIDYLKRPNGRLPDTSIQQLKNFGDTVKAISQDTDGSLKLYAKHQDGKVLQEFRITKLEASAVLDNTYSQRKELENSVSQIYRKVLMRLHQTSVDDLRVGKKTSEKGIVERVDLVPRSLIYVSDLAGQKIKNEIVKHDGNPYQKGFVVDLDVDNFNGKPRAYRILEVHEVIDMDED